MRSSIQTELDNFFARLQRCDVSTRVVDKSAFSFARAKLKPEAFRELHKLAVDEFYAHTDYRTWNSLRALAFDGSTLKLPNTDEIANHFGGIDDTINDRFIPMARLMQLYDVENELCVDLTVGPYAVGEGDMAMAMIGNLRKNDLILVDRGFCDTALFAAILSLSGHLVARATDIFDCVQEFRDCNDQESFATLTIWSKARKRLIANGFNPPESIRVRLIKVELDTGETEILMTSLLDQKQFPVTIFSDLYAMRWGIEESYKLLKCRAEIDRFSGRTVHSVQQDVLATAFVTALNGIFCTLERSSIEVDHAHCQHNYKANRTSALSKMRNAFFLLFVRSQWRELLNRLLEEIRRNASMIRPKRKVAHTNVKRHPGTMAYKPVS